MLDPFLVKMGLFWVMAGFGLAALLVTAPVAVDLVVRLGGARAARAWVMNRWEALGATSREWLRAHSPCAVVAGWWPSARPWRLWR